MDLTNTQTQSQANANPLPASGILQRQCVCGSHTVSGGKCAGCSEKEQSLQRKAGDPARSFIPTIQRKLTVGASDDPLEREADRVAEEVLSLPINIPIGSALPQIQRFIGKSAQQMDTVPPSVDRVLASSGRPLEPVLRYDMEQRFGHDFSKVRIHSGGIAEQSTRELNANAYTVGHNIVFGVNRFEPATHVGRQLLAHELTHVVQQSRPGELRHRGIEIEHSSDYLHRERNIYSSAPSRIHLKLLRQVSPDAGARRILEATRDVNEWDVFLEQIAHGLVYRTGEFTREEIEWLSASGYQPIATRVHRSEGGIGFLGLSVRRGRDNRPILAFAGSEIEAPDWTDDFGVVGPGVYQFFANQPLIQNVLHDLHEDGPVVLTGHSLGGALAQLTASTYPEFVGEVVTFQSPGVPQNFAQQIINYNSTHLEEQIESRHHRVAGDIVPGAGEAFTPGTAYEYDLGLGAAAAHSSRPLENLYAYQTFYSTGRLHYEGAAGEFGPTRGARPVSLSLEDVQRFAVTGRRSRRPVEEMRRRIAYRGSIQSHYALLWLRIRGKITDGIDPAALLAIITNVADPDIAWFLENNPASLVRMLRNLHTLYPNRFEEAEIQAAIQALSQASHATVESLEGRRERVGAEP